MTRHQQPSLFGIHKQNSNDAEWDKIKLHSVEFGKVFSDSVYDFSELKGSYITAMLCNYNSENRPNIA